ncbi:MAG TPA: DNA glycosylase [Acidimicrobiaceae bacterium]|nr:DNA glycosylase [Acidimicrobiaceae bacterium]
MPEGHTIHRLARDLGEDLLDRPVAATARQERFADGARRLDGQVLTGAEAHGKHLFLHWDGGEVLYVHLGLIGKFRRHQLPAPEPSPNLRLRLSGEATAWDLTGPMTCELRDPDVVDEVTATLGPDPLRRRADPRPFIDAVRRSRKPIGALLLDQSVIAGIGNVYRAEVLHLAGIDPSRPGQSLSEDEVRTLWRLSVEQLRLGLKRNRIVTVPLGGRRLTSISREESFHVYKQERCRTCGADVVRSPIGNRTSYACATCQSA